MGNVKMKGIWMQFLKWYAVFHLDEWRETIARRFVFSVMFIEELERSRSIIWSILLLCLAIEAPSTSSTKTTSSGSVCVRLPVGAHLLER